MAEKICLITVGIWLITFPVKDKVVLAIKPKPPATAPAAPGCIIAPMAHAVMASKPAKIRGCLAMDKKTLVHAPTAFEARVPILEIPFTMALIDFPISFTGQFCNATVAGIVCSLAQDRIGLLGSMCVHVGFNLYGWQFIYNQNFSETVKKLRAVYLKDVVNPRLIGLLAGGFIDDALSPLVLTFQLGHKILLKCKGTAV